jgi:hypothetical protein
VYATNLADIPPKEFRQEGAKVYSTL